MNDAIFAFQDLLEGGLPCLQSLAIIHDPQTSNSLSFDSSATLNGALPSLQCLQVLGVEIQWSVDFPALEELHVWRISIDELFEMITLAPKLRELVVENPPEDEDLELAPTIKAEVEVLALKVVHRMQLIDFFTRLPLGKLRSLTIENYIMPNEVENLETDDLLLSSAGSLVDLKLYGCDHTIIDCLAVISSTVLRNLTHLTIIPLCGGEFQGNIDVVTPQLRELLTLILHERANSGAPPLESLTIASDLLGEGDWMSVTQHLIMPSRCTCGSLLECAASVRPFLDRSTW
ncbi:hypothetical protein DL93DRAFT_2095367 [Clavulina sp. PMI_390]|nr:hypothetical protein DL93DRAFT_2095367 [Clavulina sp. PMI_390]